MFAGRTLHYHSRAIQEAFWLEQYSDSKRGHAGPDLDIRSLEHPIGERPKLAVLKVANLGRVSKLGKNICSLERELAVDNHEHH